jgi:light-regulated signal transduction histidine kinase (bacteriophytochrome)
LNSGYHPKEFFQELWRTISAGETWQGEIKNRAKDGAEYWVNTSIIPLRDEKGVPYQYVSIRFDITEMKSIQAQLERSNRELQDFASVAAHDLQEPLRKIRAFSDRFVSKFRDSVPPEGHGYIDRMQDAAKRMQVLIEDLLSFSQITTKAKPFAEVDLDRILNGVLSDLEIRIEQEKAVLEISEFPKSAPVFADETQMRQLFQNILSNSLKFHKPGVSPILKISSMVRDGFLQIEIRDNGIGFEMKYLDRIFTIFQRLHGRTEYEGTGVGLAICRKIVERHGGSITAESELGRGSLFIIKLPLLSKNRKE